MHDENNEKKGNTEPELPRDSMTPEVTKQTAPSMDRVYIFTIRNSNDVERMIYIFITRDGYGVERMVATTTSPGVMPMIGLEGEQVMMERIAQEIANNTGTKIQLWKYQDRALVKTIERQLVQPAGIGDSAKIGGFRDKFEIVDAGLKVNKLIK